MNDIKKLIGRDSLTVAEVMQKIDMNACGILFLVRDNGTLVGCITDGDIRRYLLAGGRMTGAAVDAANTLPMTAKSEEEAKKIYYRENWWTGTGNRML